MSDSTVVDKPLNVDEYINENLGPHTHRRRSEVDNKPIVLEDARIATNQMRQRLESTFRGFSETNFDSVSWHSAEEMKQQYNESLKQIPPDNSIVDTSLSLDSFLRVAVERNPSAIMQNIETQYTEGTIPHSFLKLMQNYQRIFELSPQKAATLTMRYVTASIPQLRKDIDEIKTSQGLSEAAAARKAFQKLVDEIPQHSSELSDLQDSLSADKQNLLPIAKAHAQLLLRMNQARDPGAENASIFISEEDKDGLVEAYHIQDKPYEEEEIQLASTLLEKNPFLGSTLIAFQQAFINYSWSYLRMHPERLNENLEPYNPIFIPIRDAEGTVVSLAPNPKLIKSMCNNWLPSVARDFRAEYADVPIDQIDPSLLTAAHIESGIQNAESYSIFKSIIGEFVKTEDPNLLEWKGSFPIACPAKNMFTNSGKALMPSIYSYLQTATQSNATES